MGKNHKMDRSLGRNQYMLKGPLKKKGYDWWWHNFTGVNKRTGEEKAFFIEYYVCNPALGGNEPVIGSGRKPSYAMIKCGHWGKNARQIHNFYGLDQYQYKKGVLDIQIGPCTLSEVSMKGSCTLGVEEAQAHPEYLSDAGSMEWNLKIHKKISYSVGYGASWLFRAINAFEMFWHVQGMKTEYEGEVILEGEVYEVRPATSFGYADKNWGGDYTSPWLWLGGCDLKSNKTGAVLKNSAFDFGGGRPKVFGVALSRKLLGCLSYEGRKYEYNFSKFWLRSSIEFSFEEKETENCWTLKGKNRNSLMIMDVTCKKEEMLLINYVSPDGKKRHNRLWNGGNATGRIQLFDCKMGKQILVDDITIGHVGCEYGEYDD